MKIELDEIDIKNIIFLIDNEKCRIDEINFRTIKEYDKIHALIYLDNLRRKFSTTKKEGG